MHTYQKSKHEDLWTVGYFDPTREVTAWRALRDFSTEKDAASYVNFLNGGKGTYFEGPGAP